MLVKRKRQWIWTTREGKRIPIEDLEDDHLINIMRYINRRCCLAVINELGRLESYIEQAPDGAAYAAEQERNELLAKPTLILEGYERKRYEALLAEMIKRGLYDYPEGELA